MGQEATFDRSARLRVADRPIPVDRGAIMPVTKRPFVECRKLTPAATLHSLSVTNAVSQRAMTNRCGWRFDLEGVSGRSLERMGLRMPDESANRPRSLFRIKMAVLIIAFLGSWVAIAFHLVRDINELRIFGLMMLCAYLYVFCSL